MAKKKYAGTDSLLTGNLFKDSHKDHGDYSNKPVVKCYQSHPAIQLATGKIIGSNAATPVTDTADVYVGLDWTAKPKAKWPWLPGPHPVDVYYPITDMDPPADTSSFKAMVDWLCNQLHEGKTVHIGCIGGHGRTGLLITAIMSVMSARAYTQGLSPWAAVLEGVPDSDLLKARDVIQWVRKHYCNKAVESSEQIEWLMKNYAVNTAEASKTFSKQAWGGGSTTGLTLPSPRSRSPYANSGGSSAPTSSNPRAVVDPFTHSTKNVWKKVGA